MLLNEKVKTNREAHFFSGLCAFLFSSCLSRQLLRHLEGALNSSCDELSGTPLPRRFFSLNHRISIHRCRRLSFVFDRHRDGDNRRAKIYPETDSYISRVSGLH